MSKVEDRISYLEHRGIAVKGHTEVGHDLHFPLGACKGVLGFFDGRPRLTIIKDDVQHHFYENEIEEAAETEIPRTCDVEKG